MNCRSHADRVTEYRRHEELWLLLTEKLVVDSDRRRLVSTPSFLRSGITLFSNQFVILKLDILYKILSESRISIQVADSEDYTLGRRLQQTLWESLPDCFAAYPFIHAGDTYMLINLREPVNAEVSAAVDRVLEQLYHACLGFVSAVRHDMNLKVQIYMGPFISTMDKMEFKFETLNNMAKVDFSFIQNLDVVMPPDARLMHTADNASQVAQTKVLATRMVNLAVDHHFDEALSAAFQLIDLEASNYDTALSLAIRMGSRIETLFDMLGVPPSCSKQPSLRAYACKEALLESSSVLDLKETVSKVFSDFEEYFTPSPTIPVKNRIDEICTYIHANYSDLNLCSDMICREFGISGAYLSRLFKEQMGTKLIDYIHRIRIDEATRLLRDTPLTVEQIAYTVGYQSALTLTRAYKRYYNMSPGLARKNSSQ